MHRRTVSNAYHESVTYSFSCVGSFLSLSKVYKFRDCECLHLTLFCITSHVLLNSHQKLLGNLIRDGLQPENNKCANSFSVVFTKVQEGIVL